MNQTVQPSIKARDPSPTLQNRSSRGSSGGGPAQNSSDRKQDSQRDSGRKSNIMNIDESGQSLIDFDLSQSKFSMGVFENRDSIDQKQ